MSFESNGDHEYKEVKDERDHYFAVGHSVFRPHRRLGDPRSDSRHAIGF
jgi:hypothetical protein